MAPILRLLPILAVSLPPLIWYFTATREELYWLFSNFPPYLVSGVAGVLGAFNGVIISSLALLIIKALASYRKASDMVKNCSVTISEQVLSIHTADTRIETEWKNVRKITNNRQKLQILVHRSSSPSLICCISVPKRAFTSKQEATAYAEAALRYWKAVKTEVIRERSSRKNN